MSTALTEPLPVADPVPLLDLGAMHDEVRDELDATWRRTVDTSGFVGGSPVEAFEHEWARYCGTKHAVGVANGTDALVLALRCLGVGPGDEVIVPANTFVATAEAVVLAGARPRFIDVDPDTLLMTAEHVEAALSYSTAAVIVVHLYGQLPDMDAIGAVARKAGIAVVEDAAQAHGARWNGLRAGSFGDVGCFSFYPGKNLGAFGDGGAVVTSDPRLAEAMRCTADHGRRRGSKYVHDVVGTNSRLDALQAGVLSVKLRRLDAWNSARRAAMARYGQLLSDDEFRLVRVDPRAESVHHLAVGQVDARDAMIERLEHVGIATGIHYPLPCHLQHAFRRYARERLPVCEQAADRLLSLPLFPSISDEQIARVSAALTGPVAVGRRSRRVIAIPDQRQDLSNAG